MVPWRMGIMLGQGLCSQYPEPPSLHPALCLGRLWMRGWHWQWDHGPGSLLLFPPHAKSVSFHISTSAA